MGRAAVLVLVFVLAGYYAGDEGRAGERSAADARERGVAAVQAYCGDFAMRYAANNAVGYRRNSARTEMESGMSTWVSNIFQPPGSRFTAGYRCRFQTRDKEGEVREISVNIFLAETLHFAEYTKWQDLQIVPIKYVVDEVNDKKGYGVFKYLKSPLR